jgi:protocatechuate 3,4-dioxygenase beta subunit
MSQKALTASVLSILCAFVVTGWLLWQGEEAPPVNADPAGQAPAAAAPETPAGPLAQADAGSRGDDGPAARRAAVEPPRDGQNAGATARKVKVSGRLVDERGQGVAGIELSWSRFAGVLPGELGQVATAERKADARSDASGAFSLFVEASRGGTLSPRERDRVFADEETGLVRATDRDLDLGDLRLVSAAAIAGVVRDQRGQPLAGVGLRVNRGDGPYLFGLAAARTRTDQEGRFEINGLRGGAWRVQTESSRHVPDSKRVELGAGERRDDLVFELREGGFIAGTVVDDLGRPVAGARVAAQRKRTSGPGIVIEGLMPGEAATTDATGQFQIGGLEEALVAVRASAAGHGSASKNDIPLRSTDVVLRLARNGVVKGTLRDTEGRPIQGSEVRAQPAGREMPFVAMMGPGLTRTDDRGDFTLTEVPAGMVDVSAEGDSHVQATPVRVEVRPGETVEGVKLSAARGAILAVLVTDADGKPVADAEVEVADKESNEGSPAGPGAFRGRRIEHRGGHGRDFVFDSDGRQVLGRGRTGADGMARIGGLPAGPAVCTSSHKELARPKPAHLTLPAAGVVETRLTMRRGGFADVLVVDADGQPKKASVRLEGPDGAGSEQQQKTTGEDGKLRIGPLLEGGYTATIVVEPKPMRAGGAVLMWGGNQRAIEATRTPFAVRENETIEIKVVHPALATVRGTVRDAQGLVSGAEVELLEGDMPRLPMTGGMAAKTDQQGTFEIPDVAPGRYRISFGRKNAPVPFEEALEVDPGQTEVRRDLVLNGGIVTVIVFGKDGEPLRGARVTLGETRAAGTRRSGAVMISMVADSSDTESMTFLSGDTSTTTDEDGKAEMKDVPPGKYSLTIEHARHMKHVSKDVTVVAQNTTDVGTLRLVAGGQLKGTVTLADGTPVQFAQVQITPVGGGESERAMAMNGAFKVGALKPGKYRVSASEPAMPWSEPVEVEIKADETANVRVSLPAK